MKYVLAVLTHGERDTMTAAVESFHRHVGQRPETVVVHADGPHARARLCGMEFSGPDVWRISTGSQAGDGFCESTRRLWYVAVDEATQTRSTHVFWLEHDFVLRRDVDLEALARVMAGQSAFSGQPLAQMALMRNAVSTEERRAGGLYESRQREYRNEGAWLSHSSYFTTNPSLMSVLFMRQNPWPSYTRECEGRFGIDLVDAGYHFGVWGDGSPYVEHVGVRTGHGY